VQYMRNVFTIYPRYFFARHTTCSLLNEHITYSDIDGK
jgi:hypothetical protein